MRSHLALISKDFPTLKPRVDDPQSRRGGDHNRRERSSVPIYRRKAAREASQRIGAKHDLQVDDKRSLILSMSK